jgi:hypothetical protein
VLHIKPSRASVEEFRKELRTLWKKVINIPLEEAIGQLNEKVLGWGNYHRHYISKRIFASLDNWMWERSKRYRYRRHPRKSWRWCKRRYWGEIPSRRDKWVFMNPETGRYLYKLEWIPIYRHKLVKGRHSPDDPNLKEYWSKRQQERIPYGSKVRLKLWQRQKGLCSICQGSLEEEALEVHHLKARGEGGGNQYANLCLVHKPCHKQIHSTYGEKLKLSLAA